MTVRRRWLSRPLAQGTPSLSHHEISTDSSMAQLSHFPTPNLSMSQFHDSTFTLFCFVMTLAVNKDVWTSRKTLYKCGEQAPGPLNYQGSNPKNLRQITAVSGNLRFNGSQDPLMVPRELGSCHRRADRWGRDGAGHRVLTTQRQQKWKSPQQRRSARFFSF